MPAQVLGIPLGPALLPLWLALFYVGISLFLGLMAGWFVLAARFPDQGGARVLRGFSGLSGNMGVGVSFNRVLKVDVCEEGLRLALARWAFPFTKAVFLPWRSLTATRRRVLGVGRVELAIADVKMGRLTLKAADADALWRAAGARWPEPGAPPPPAPLSAYLKQLALVWAGVSALVLVLLTAVGSGAAPAAGPPKFLFVLIPALLGALLAAFAVADHRRNRE